MLARIKEYHIYFAIAAVGLMATGIAGDAGMKKTAMASFLIALGALWIGVLVWSEER